MNNRLRELRDRSNLTVRDIAEKTGISFSTISFIENGKRRMNIRVATILSEFFGVSIDYLTGQSFEERLNKFVNGCKQDYSVIKFDKENDPSVCIDKESLTDVEKGQLDIILYSEGLRGEHLENVRKAVLKEYAEQRKEEFLKDFDD